MPALWSPHSLFHRPLGIQAPRKLTLHVSLAVVLFFIWDRVGKGPRKPGTRVVQTAMPVDGQTGGKGSLKEAQPSALGTWSRGSQMNFLFVVCFFSLLRNYKAKKSFMLWGLMDKSSR